MSLEPGDLILRTSDLYAAGWTDDRIRIAVRRGEVVRIRRGSYCDGQVWRTLDDRQRHVLLVCAVAGDVSQPVVTGMSAAAVWDVPVLGSWPSEVSLLIPVRPGGKSEPGLRRTSVGSRDAPVVTHHGIRVTSLPRTVVDLAAKGRLEDGLVAADWALGHGMNRAQLQVTLARRTSSRGSRLAATVIELANPAAANPGESATRAAIIQAGFEVPELQVRFADGQGEMWVDFFWPSVRVAGEFDGKHKYTRNEFTHGNPAEAVWKEKKREDRLRRMTEGVVRMLWTHVRTPLELVQLLSGAGIPRRRNP